MFFGHLYVIVTGAESLTSWHFDQMGVLSFFVHTSLVLMLSMERSPANGRDWFLSFYLRRSFRIYPLSMVCVTIAMILHRSPAISEPVVYWTWPQYFSNLALTTNLLFTPVMVGGLWTLPIEVQMYITLPFLFLAGRKYGLKLLGALWLLAIPVAFAQLRTTRRLDVLGYVPCFIAGAIAWRLSTMAPRRIPGWLWPFAMVSVWPVFFAARHGNDMPFRWAYCLVLGLALPWFQEFSWAPLVRVAHWIAKYSYGIYLSHIALMLWCFNLPVPRPAQLAVFVPLAVATPVAMFHFIEDPMIRFGQRLAKRLFDPARS